MAEAGDAVAEVTPEAPTVEAPTVEAPAPEAAAPAAEAPAPEYGWIDEFGGVDAVREAAEFRRNVGTEEGAVDAFVEFGVALGLTPAQLASLFPEEAAEAVQADAEEMDQPMTRREAQEYVEQLIADAVINPLNAREEANATEAVRNTLISTLDAANIPEADRHMVLQFADSHVPEADRYNTAAVAAGVAAGIADFNAWLDKQVEARIGAKAAANENIPTPLTGGSTGGGEADAEPMSVAEAKARVRAQYGGR